MHDARLILDFPGHGRNRERLEPAPPRRVIAAHRLEEVRPALREAEQAAADGAWVAGFVAYEAAPAFDAALVTRPHRGPVPLLWFGVFDAPVPGTGFGERIPGAAAGASVPALWPADAWSPQTARAEYDAAICSIREAIADGSVYQVNYTLRFRAPCDLAAADLYDALVVAGHGRYHALIETPEWAVVSASPELFIDIRDGIITTRPMKGTARRGRWSAEDDEAADRLARSAKDRAENLMIVDLLRNDFGRIARFGSVVVSRMFAVETYPTVHQMTSTITARLRERVTVDDVFAAAFPCGSVTGAPKVAAMQHIATLEPEPRGVYCGAIGVLRPDGTATFNVAIRTLVVEPCENIASYGTGGGITWDSVADAEYDEAVAKTTLLTRAAPHFDLLETMRLEDGRIPRLDLHLERLAASVRYWGFSDDAPRTAAAALRRLTAAVRAGTWRIRMTVARDGHVSIARVQLHDVARPTTAPDADGCTDYRHGGTSDNTVTVMLAETPIDSRDPLLYHKTTARDIYDQRRATHPDAFDVLLHNEHGCITEFTIGNVVCEIAGKLVTPPRQAGLLAGTFREQLVRNRNVAEQDVRLADLGGITRMWLINSVREWVPVVLRD